MHIFEYLNPALLTGHYADGYVRAVDHPTEPLKILNYTDKAMWNVQEWDDTLSRCRGLIYNTETEEIVARPWPKFWNHDQPQAAKISGKIRVQDKADGSLGIIYLKPSDGTYAVATRGSFTSDQAIWATEFLNSRYPNFWLLSLFTPLVEIIYPENRVVLDYSGWEGFVLLDIIHNETGESFLGSHLRAGDSLEGIPIVQSFDYSSLSEVLSSPDRDNAEGFVITDESGNKVKYKYEEYKRLHKLLTGVSTRTIWELLSTGQSFDAIIEVVPDEFYDWVRSVESSLRAEFRDIEEDADFDFQEIKSLMEESPWYLNDEGVVIPFTGKEQRAFFAQMAKETSYPALMFALLDEKDIAPMIWKMIKPEYSKPFQTVSEDNA